MQWPLRCTLSNPDVISKAQIPIPGAPGCGGRQGVPHVVHPVLSDMLAPVIRKAVGSTGTYQIHEGKGRDKKTVGQPPSNFLVPDSTLKTFFSSLSLLSLGPPPCLVLPLNPLHVEKKIISVFYGSYFMCMPRAHVEVRGKRVGIGSLLLPCVTWESNSTLPAGIFPMEPSC